MIRRIIKIDEEKCNGCGICANACHEGAIGIVGGKAKLLREDYCDGLGDCLPACPAGAISFEEREAPAYNEEAVLASKALSSNSKTNVPPDAHGKIATPSNAHGKIAVQSDTQGKVATSSDAHDETDSKPHTDPAPAGIAHPHAKPFAGSHGCPGAAARVFNRASAGHFPGNSFRNAHRASQCGAFGTASASSGGFDDGSAPATASSGGYDDGSAPVSELLNWPVQIKLAPVKARYYDGARLLISADCAAFARGDFHERFMKGSLTVIGCPKLDQTDYSEKLAEILRQNDISSIIVTRMEVPCCAGIERTAKLAVEKSGKRIPTRTVTIRTDGGILADTEE